VRGQLCQYHNSTHLPPYEHHDYYWLRRRRPVIDEETIAWLMRCPECAELGPWQPQMVRMSPSQVGRNNYLIKREESRAAWEAEAAQRHASALKGWETRRQAAAKLVS
jgi:hypothetical protein